jgi:hypothetical protein
MTWKAYWYCGKCHARFDAEPERCRSCNSLDISKRDGLGGFGLKQSNAKFGRFNYEAGSDQDHQDHPERAARWSAWSRLPGIRRVDKSD